MGNFTLIHKANKSGRQLVVNYYTRKLKKTPVVLHAGDYDLIYCDKAFLSESHLVVHEESFVCFSGTPILIGTNNIRDTVQGLFSRLQQGKFDHSEIRGSYSFVFYQPGKLIQIGHDPVKVAGMFANSDKTVVSSSFICSVLGSQIELAINRNAVTELCLLGHITGRESMFEGIDKFYFPAALENSGIQWVDASNPSRPVLSGRKFKEEVRAQIKMIESFFSDVAGFFNHYGVNLGISDGHDSRLLAEFFNRKIKRSTFYTFWRNKETPEIKIAKQVAEKSKKEISMVGGKDVYDKSEEELVQNFEDAFLLYDGQPRLHCYFFDDFNTRKFVHMMAGKNSMNATGVGGEQYRNDQHLQFNKIKPPDFFCENLLDQSVPGTIKDPEVKKKLVAYLIDKFDREMKDAGLTGQQGYYDRYQLHFFFNEYLNNAFRLNRNNGENQYMMHISPFLDRQLVFNSYAAIKLHGISFSFQQEMIRNCAPELAKVISVYGYPFSKHEPFIHKLKYLLKHFTPNSILVKQRMKLYHDKEGWKMLDKFPVLKEYLQMVEALDLPINVEKLFCHADRWPLLMSLGFSIRYFENLKKQLAV